MTPRLRQLVDHHPKVSAAYHFAAGAHYGVGQLRPTLDDPTVPYIVHPVEVAGIVAEVPFVSVDQVVAALLHDVLEDTKVSLSVLHALFGLTVAEYVMHLTDYYTPENFPDLNRAERKRLECIRLSHAPDEVKTIKLADGLSNTPSIAINKPKFMSVYGPEKRAAWESLRGGDTVLWHRLDVELKKWSY